MQYVFSTDIAQNSYSPKNFKKGKTVLDLILEMQVINKKFQAKKKDQQFFFFKKIDKKLMKTKCPLSQKSWPWQNFRIFMSHKNRCFWQTFRIQFFPKQSYRICGLDLIFFRSFFVKPVCGLGSLYFLYLLNCILAFNF